MLLLQQTIFLTLQVTTTPSTLPLQHTLTHGSHASFPSFPLLYPSQPPLLSGEGATPARRGGEAKGRSQRDVAAGYLEPDGEAIHL